MIETYSVLVIDLVCVVVSYAVSLFIRFNIIHYENYPKQFHLMVGAYIVILCLLYNMFLDANRNYFIRGYYQEFYYTVRYTLILVVGLVVILYLLQQSYAFSRSFLRRRSGNTTGRARAPRRCLSSQRTSWRMR